MATVLNEPLSRHAPAFVLAGGRGSRPLESTDRRAKRGLFRRKISHHRFCPLQCGELGNPSHRGCGTQYKAHSLIRHLQMGWNFFRPERNESFDTFWVQNGFAERLIRSIGASVWITSLFGARHICAEF
jgi:glucose-1-phosphate adenylyltransferase